MVLRNFVELPSGQPVRLHFTRGQLVDQAITDPLTKQPKMVTALQLLVDEVDGKPQSATLSVIQEKLAAQLMPWVENGRLPSVGFIITRNGSGFGATFTVEVVPRGQVRR